MGWSLIALVIASPLNLVFVFLGALDAVVDQTTPPGLIAAALIVCVAAGSAAIILIIAPFLGASALATGARRWLRRAVIAAVLSPTLVLILIVAGRWCETPRRRLLCPGAG